MTMHHLHSKSGLTAHLKQKNADDPDAANPSPNISGDDKHHEDKDDYKPFSCASRLEKGVGGFSGSMGG